MALSEEQRRSRREAGVARANRDMTIVQRVHRGLVTGRPPASEFRTSTGAVTAARILQREIEARMQAAGQEPGQVGVEVVFVTPDLSSIGHTVLYAPGLEASMMEHLDGNIPLGLVFGLVDREAREIIRGARPFIATKQIDEWLAEAAKTADMSDLELRWPDFARS